jgi:hypothetical protein
VASKRVVTLQGHHYVTTLKQAGGLQYHVLARFAKSRSNKTVGLENYIAALRILLLTKPLSLSLPSLNGISTDALIPNTEN